MNPMVPTRVVLCITALNLALSSPAVHAASGTWDGGSATPNWGFLANWVSGEASGTGFTATFGDAFANGYSMNLNTNRTIGNITLNNSALEDFTINQINSAVFTFNVSSGSPTVTVTDAARTLTINVPIGGNNGMTKAGPGSLVLSDTVSYTGNTLVTAGTLNLTSNRVANMGGTLDIGGANAVLNLSADLPMAASQFRPGNATGNGTVNQTAGAVTFTGGNQLTLGTNAATVGFYNLSGGSFTTASVGNRGLILGVNTNCVGTFTLSGTGVVDVVPGSSLQIGRTESGQAVDNATGTFAQTGGTATISDLRMGGGNAGNSGIISTLDLSGGTFSAASFPFLSVGNNSVSIINISGAAEVTLPDLPTTRGIGATATVTFDGGTLKNLAGSSDFLGGLTQALIKAGGANLDTSAGAATISQDLSEDAGSTGGGLTKIGAPDLILAGTNTYTGATNADEGSLKFSTAAASATDLTVADSAAGGVLVAVDDDQWVNAGDLTYDNNSAVVIDYGTSIPSTTIAPIAVDNFNVGTNLGLKLEGTEIPNLVVSQAYPLVTWTTSGPSDGSAFTTVLVGGLSGNFSVSGSTLSFTVTSNTAGQPISWNTGNASWDTSTTNWVDGALATVAYVDPLDGVLFGDAAGATGNPSITLDSNFSPVGVTINSASRDYTIAGTGGIGGLDGVTLDAANTGTLTLTTANTYLGATSIDGGTLQLGNGGSDGSLSSGSAITVAAGATFAVNQDDTVTQGVDFGGAAIDGLGGFSQVGSGTTVLNAVNTFGGPTSISGGTLQIDGTGSLDGGTYAGNIAISSGSTLQYSSSAAQTLSGIISGAGSLTKEVGGGVLTLTGPNSYSGNTTLSAGNLTLGASDVIGDSSAVIQDGGTLRIADGVVETLHSLTSSAGILLFGNGTTSGSSEITLLNNSAVDDIQVGITGILGLAPGVTLTQSSAGTISQLGDNDSLTFDVGAGGLADIAGEINTGDGNGAINKTGSGTLRLTSDVSSWGGGTVIENGTLEFDDIANFTVASSLGDADTVDVLQIGSTATAATLRMIGTSAANSSDRSVQLGDAGGIIDVDDPDQTLTLSWIVSDANTSGSLTKAGDGTLVLSGQNTYSGATLVSAGSLQFSTDALGASDITIAANAVGGPLVSSNDAQFVSGGGLTLDNDGVLGIYYGSTTPSTTVAPIQVDNFAFGSTPGVILEAASISSLGVGQTYPLVTWTGTGPLDGSAFSIVSHRNSLIGTFSVAANTLSVTIDVNSPPTITWNAGDGTWDELASNWLDSSLAATAYVDPLDGVIFGDAAGASGNPVITLDSILTPLSLTMNSTSHDYSISGTGGIAGAGALTLDAANTRTLTLSTANDTYTGDVTIDGGTLVGAGAVSGSGGVRVFGAGSSARTFTVNSGTTLQFDSGNIFSGNFSTTNVPAVVVNGGTVTNGGIATNNAFGLVTLNSGTLTATTGSTSGYGGFNLNSTVTSTGSSLISTSDPVNGVMMLTSNGPNNVATSTAFDVQSGTLTISAPLGEVSGESKISGFTKSGAGTMVLSGTNTYTGTTAIDEGILEITAAQTLAGGLTFGTAAGSTATGALDLSAASASFADTALVQTNNAVANTISIGASQTLSLNGGLTMGYDAGGGTGATRSNLTASGAGSLVITGTTIAVSVNQAGSNRPYWSAPTLDVSGLGVFSADVTNFNVGVGNNTHGPGTVLLSDTANTILATRLQVGNTGSNNGRGTSTLTLGTGTNVIQVDTVWIGRNKSSGPGVVKFDSQVSSSPGTVVITDKAGSGRANFDIANIESNGTGNGAIGTLDLRGHVATVSAGTVTLGNHNGNASNASTTTGIIHFDEGTFDVDTLIVAPKSNGGLGTARGTLNVGGGAFIVNTAFTLGSQIGNGASLATVNLTGGTLTSSVDIVDGGGVTTSTINLSGGTLEMVGNAIGTLADPIDLTVEFGALQNVGSINGTGGFTKTTAGTLLLTGTNAYTGATIVSEGTLALVGGSHASAITANSLASLGFTLGSPTTSTDSVTFDSGSTVTITGTPTLPSYTLMTASSFAGIAPVLNAPIAGYALTVDGGTELKLVQSGGYSTWAATNAGGQTEDLDFDGDGVPNGVEYFMNAAAGFTANPGIDASGTITWPNGGNIPAADYGPTGQFVIQTSSDLSSWADVSIGDLMANTDGPAGELTYTLTGGAPRFVRLMVTPN